MPKPAVKTADVMAALEHYGFTAKTRTSSHWTFHHACGAVVTVCHTHDEMREVFLSAILGQLDAHGLVSRGDFMDRLAGPRLPERIDEAELSAGQLDAARRLGPKMLSILANWQAAEDLLQASGIGFPQRLKAANDLRRTFRAAKATLEEIILADAPPQAATDGKPQQETETDPCLAKREPGEPMFVLLARDAAAPETMEKWCELRRDEMDRGVRPDSREERQQVMDAWSMACEFRLWREAREARETA